MGDLHNPQLGKKMKQLTANLYVGIGGYDRCNAGFWVTSKGVVIIDTPSQPSEALWWREESARRGNVRYIINTEYHEDHTTGNSFLPGITIGHEETKKGLDGYVKTADSLREKLMHLFPEDRDLLRDYSPRTLEMAFSEHLTLYLGDQLCELIHLPGHTPGQTAVYLPLEKVVFTGDNFTKGLQPSFSYSLPREWLASLDHILSLDAEWIVPGHGDIGDKTAVRDFRSFLDGCIEEVRQAIQRGWTPEEAAERISFESRLSAIHPGLEQQRKNISRLYEMLA